VTSGGSQNGIKSEMLELMDDPDRFDRFNDQDKAGISEIALGWAFFAKSRFKHLHEAIRRRGIPCMHTHNPTKTPPTAQGDKRWSILTCSKQAHRPPSCRRTGARRDCAGVKRHERWMRPRNKC
jgi:hypothetical protein